MKEDSARSHGTKIVIAALLFFVLFSMAPTMYEWNARLRIHDDRFFELVHNFPTDYDLYLSRIREGKEGAWMATEKYTSEPHTPSLSQEMYVLIGRMADYAHIQTPYVWFAYHVSRVFFAALLLWVIWLVSKWVFAEQGFGWQFLTFLLVTTASTWPKFEVVAGVPRLGGWMGWYTMSDSLQRTTFMPHVTFAQAMVLFIIWVFSTSAKATADGSGGFITKVTPGNYVFLGIVGFVLGIIFPPGLLFIYGVLGFVTVGEFFRLWWTRGLGGKGVLFADIRAWFVRDLFGRIVFGIISAPTFVYFGLLLSQYPWKRLVEFDVLHPTAFSMTEYFLALGPTFPLGILGIVLLLVLRKHEQFLRLRMFIGWVTAWFVFLFVFEKIPQQSPTRWTQMAPHVPLGIFTGYLFYQLTALAGKVVPHSKTQAVNRESGIMNNRKNNSTFISVIHYSLFIIPVVMILFGLGTMSSSYMWLQDFIDHKLRATIPLVPQGADVMYPMLDIINGLTWLQVNTPRSDIILTGMTTGNYTPVYAGNTVYVGHANTVHLEEKLAAVRNFFVKRLTIEEELAWLKDSHIAYVFYGPEEQDMAAGLDDLRTLYPMLTQVYENKTVRIYKTP